MIKFVWQVKVMRMRHNMLLHSLKLERLVAWDEYYCTREASKRKVNETWVDVHMLSQIRRLVYKIELRIQIDNKISCMTQINMSSRWTARIKVEDREACFKRLRKRWLGGARKPIRVKILEILESWRTLCWRVSLFRKWEWLVNQRRISFLYEGKIQSH